MLQSEAHALPAEPMGVHGAAGDATLNILLVAEESAGAQLLRALRETKHHIVGVLSSGGRAGIGGGVRALARKMGLRCWPAELVRDPAFAETVASLRVDLLLNVHSLYIVRPEILSATRLGGFNMHPGPLPELAGLNAPSWALYRGAASHGVTIHRMEREIDAGPIAYRSTFEIGEAETALTLMAKCVKHGLPLVLRLVERLAQDPGSLALDRPAERIREYKGREVPNGGRLSWSWPGRDIVNFVRACDYFPFESPWGSPTTSLGEREIGIAKAALTNASCAAPPGTVLAGRGHYPRVACIDQAVEVSHLMVQGRPILASAVLSPGQRLGDKIVER